MSESMNPNVSSSSDSEERPRTRKRQRTSKGNDDKRSRGRPRLDPQDETAAERRRTQIRLAQRAYRQRKETTISALKTQVAELQETIAEMNKAFLRFNDAVMNVGVSSEVAKELKSVTQQFVLYAKAQGNSDDEPENGLVDNDEIIHNLATEPAPSNRPSKHRSRSRASSEEFTEDIGLGYRSVYDISSIPIDENMALAENPSARSSDNELSRIEDVADDQKALNNFQRSPTHSGSSVVVSFRGENQRKYPEIDYISDPVQSFSEKMPDQVMPVAAINDLDKSTSLTNKPFIYSFQETTFARRLQRASVECGYHLIAQAHLRPRVFKRVFKLSLLYGSREQIAARFKAILTKSTSESLEFWQTPMIRLGGAGTHYPRLIEDGTPYVPPNSYDVHHVAPNTNLIQLRSVDDGSVYCDMLIDISGYEGEWFDPTDVEGYLASKGILIDPQLSFADCQILESDLPELSQSPQESEATSSLSNPTTPPLQDNMQRYSLDAGSSDLSASFFNELNNDNMTSVSPGPQDLFPPGFDPVTFTTEAFETLSKPLPAAQSPAADSTGGPQSTTPNSLMPPKYFLDHTIDTFFANFVPNPISLDSSTDIHTGFDSVDFDNIPMNEQNNWGFQAGDAFNAATAESEGMEIEEVTERRNVGVRGGEGEKAVARTRNVTIDVTRLIEELLKGGVCLGRAPGFRKKDVDRAIEVAMITAF